MEQNFDYLSLYRTRYRKLPKYYFLCVLLVLGFLTTIAGIILFYMAANEDSVYAVSALAVLSVGWLVAYGCACLARWISSIKLSQSVVVADALLEISKKSSEITAEQVVDIGNELPEI